MHTTVAIVLLTLFVQSASTAPEKAAVMEPVHRFTDAFNKGDTKAAAAMCAAETSIIDEFPPHEWHGVDACMKWMNDYDADAKKNSITDGVVTLGSPRHVDVTADHAYVVIPADYTYKQKGKTVKETGSALTVALQKGAAGWRIIGWSWTKQ
jgi:ketosteroid isomerase-like protein